MHNNSLLLNQQNGDDAPQNPVACFKMSTTLGQRFVLHLSQGSQSRTTGDPGLQGTMGSHNNNN